MSFRAAMIASALALAGCPPDVAEPDPPPGEPCVTSADCTPPGAPCGLIYACIAEVCETESSRTQPCDGGL